MGEKIALNYPCHIDVDLSSEVSVPEKSVRFDSCERNQIHVFDVVPFEDGRYVWYSPSEANAMKADRKQLAKVIKVKIANNVSLDDDSEGGCRRGLENLLDREFNKDRIRTKRQSIQAVLAEQGYQRCNRVHDPESIAEIYSSNGTMRWQKYAYDKAIADEKDCLRIVDEDNRKNSIRNATSKSKTNKLCCDNRSQKGKRNSTGSLRHMTKQKSLGFVPKLSKLLV